MEHFTWLPTSIAGIFGALAPVGAVIYMFLTGFFKKKKEVEGELDVAQAELIHTLQETVDALKEKVDVLEEKYENLSSDHEETKKKLAVAEEDNKRLVEIFQGRDEKSQELFEMIKHTNDNVKKLIDYMERHLSFVEKKVDNL